MTQYFTTTQTSQSATNAGQILTAIYTTHRRANNARTEQRNERTNYHRKSR